MEGKHYFEKFVELQEKLLTYLQEEKNVEVNFHVLRRYLDQKKINQKDEGFIEFLHLISRISTNHHRTPFFQTKIEKILISYKDDIKANFTNTCIFNIFKKNKLLLLFLFEEKIINFDQNILNLFEKEKSIKAFFDRNDFKKYFAPEIQQFSQTQNQSNESLESFRENRKIGENHHYICKLIRNDSVEEFIKYVNKNSINLSSQIEFSIFENNSFLINKNPTIIQYAAFFGSIQIIQYLRLNGIELSSSLWLYAIHSNNAELIHLLEEFEEDKIGKLEYFKEAVKCHHNEIAKYFKDNYQLETQNYCPSKMIKYYNFEFIETNSVKSHFFYLCCYDYFALVKILLNDKSIDLNRKTIFFCFFFI